MRSGWSGVARMRIRRRCSLCTAPGTAGFPPCGSSGTARPTCSDRCAHPRRSRSRRRRCAGWRAPRGRHRASSSPSACPPPMSGRRFWAGRSSRARPHPSCGRTGGAGMSSSPRAAGTSDNRCGPASGGWPSGTRFGTGSPTSTASTATSRHCVRLHELRWGGTTAVFAGRGHAFQRDAARALLATGRLRLWVLELDGEPAAAWQGFRMDGAESYYQSGRDPRFDSESRRLRAAVPHHPGGARRRHG